jgi:hypothetical protein
MALDAGVFEVEQATANHGIFSAETGSQHTQLTDGSWCAAFEYCLH